MKTKKRKLKHKKSKTKTVYKCVSKCQDCIHTYTPQDSDPGRIGTRG